jgi:hypothetical protein
MIGRLLRSGRHERILRLLDQEREIILNGPLSELKALVDRRETAIREVMAEGGAAPEPFLAALRAKAERNARLLKASLAGVRAADAEIGRLEAATRNLRTYTERGAQIDVRPQDITRDQRA